MNLLEKISPRLAKRITIAENGCWEVGGFRDKDGYTFYHSLEGSGYKQHRAHRFTYELYKGEIPKGLTIDHLCKNKCCCNPDHLEAVTQAENNRRAGIFDLGSWAKNRSPEDKKAFAIKKRAENKLLALKRTHCRKGHAYEGNTYIPPNGTRRCQICFYNSPSMIARKNNDDKNREVGY